MCGSVAATDLEARMEAGPPGGVRRVVAVEDLLEVARHVARSEEVRRTAAGFIGYGATRPGQRVLIGVDSQTDPAITEAVATALREMGASVDVVIAQTDPDREFDDLDDLAAQFGDPDQLLRDDWAPEIPGVTVPGDYAEYARNPSRFIYAAG
jgi:D-alanyl-D-alanine dipeptidase